MILSTDVKIISLAILFICVSMACSENGNQGHEIHTSELNRVELDHQFTITDSDEVILQMITDVKSDSQGRIYLLDQQALQIHVFDSA